MTSFGANEVREEGYMPTFKVQGQVYHLIGSLLPTPGQPTSFLQIYFISDTQAQLERKVSLFSDLNRDLLGELQTMLYEHNSYIRSLKTAMETMPEESEYQIVIRADQRPVGEHPRRYNEPSVNEVAILMVGEPSDRRDIILRSRDESLRRIYETHRSYDALQYPLMFCRDEDGYHFNMFHVNPGTSESTTRKTSLREFYAYRVMVRQGDPNHIHQFGQLFNQYLVDMYAKVESERLIYIQTHQTKLRAENYIHLQDALRRDASVDELGQVVILPSSFTGGLRYMHSRTQDAFCYVFQIVKYDEMQRYKSGRYICTSEAVWRMLPIPIHDRYPAVMHLDVHLPDEQRIYFQPVNVVERMQNSRTTLMAVFELCQTDAFARTRFYCDVPSYYTFSRLNGFSRRKMGQQVAGYPGVKRDSCIGRVYVVHPSNSERYHLRLLLHKVCKQ